jgi:hypothetical protein
VIAGLRNVEETTPYADRWLTEFEYRLDTLPQKERGSHDKENVHAHLPTEYPGGQVEQKDEENNPGYSDRRVGNDLVELHFATLR